MKYGEWQLKPVLAEEMYEISSGLLHTYAYKYFIYMKHTSIFLLGNPYRPGSLKQITRSQKSLRQMKNKKFQTTAG